MQVILLGYDLQFMQVTLRILNTAKLSFTTTAIYIALLLFLFTIKICFDTIQEKCRFRTKLDIHKCVYKRVHDIIDNKHLI